MREYKVILDDAVRETLDSIAHYIASQSTLEHARRYVNSLANELLSLSTIVGSMHESYYLQAKRIHPHAITAHSRNRKWTFILHIDGGYAIVDRIVPSSMITY